VISVQRELGVPVKLVGLGEGPDDLAPFDPAVFVDAILAEESRSGNKPVTRGSVSRNAVVACSGHEASSPQSSSRSS